MRNHEPDFLMKINHDIKFFVHKLTTIESQTKSNCFYTLLPRINGEQLRQPYYASSFFQLYLEYVC